MKANLYGIQLNPDQTVISSEAKTARIVEVRIQAPLSSAQNGRPALNLAIVLDRSGSMQGEKLEYVKQAACHVLDQLNEKDRVALVVYDDSIQVLARNMKVTHGNRFELKQLISEIRAGNMTNLSGGWLTGCKEAASAAEDGTINRTLLLTDGLANVGETDLEVLSAHAFELYRDSISTSTFGVGEGFNEHLLEAMSNRGGGNFHYIATPERIPEVFLKEFSDLVGITARKVEVSLDLPASVEWKVLGGWSTEYKDGHLHIYVGDMLSGKTQDIYLKLQIPADGKVGEWVLNVKIFGQGRENEVLEDTAKVAFQFTGQKEVDAAPLNLGVMERFGMVEMADETTEALKLERNGQREDAERRVRESLARHQRHLSPQATSNYEGISNRMKAGMSEEDRKRTHWENYNIKRQKNEQEK